MPFKFRFSLRMLLLGVLTLAAGVALWQNWPELRMERQYKGGKQGSKLIGYSPDEKWIFATDEVEPSALTEPNAQAGTNAYTTRLWDVDSGAMTELRINVAVSEKPKSPNTQQCLAIFSDDSKYLWMRASDGDRCRIKIWNMQSLSEIALPSRLTDELRYAFFSTGKNLLFAGLRDGTLCCFDLNSGTAVKEFPNTKHVYISESEERIAIVFSDEILRVFDARTFAELQCIEPPVDWRCKRISYLSKKALIAIVEFTEGEDLYRTEYDLDKPVSEKFGPDKDHFLRYGEVPIKNRDYVCVYYIPMPAPHPFDSLRGESKSTSDRLHFLIRVNTSGTISQWGRRVPDKWWGVTWLPEFWVVVVLGCLFIVNLAWDLSERA